MEVLFKGIILGICIAAPVGPIGILCIRRTLQFGRFSGLFSGLGAAVADAIYAIIAAFGLTFISDFMIEQQFWLRLIGGTFLIYLGWTTFFSHINDQSKTVSHTTLSNDFLSTFFLTISNPMTIFSFIAIFAGFGLSSIQASYFEASVLVFGVFLGSSAWWILLSEGITSFRNKVSPEMMVSINRFAGLIIAIFGIIVLLSTF